MLYFADGERTLETADSLERVAAMLETLTDDSASNRRISLPRLHAQVVGASIALGELHQGVLDALYPEEDTLSIHSDRFGRASQSLGRCVFTSHSLLRNLAEPAWNLSELLASARDVILEIGSMDLPARVQARIPEGYAFYSLYPEMYFESMRRLVEAVPSASGYFVVGVRSIGTSLGGLVSGALEQAGHDSLFETVRPRGHPFERYLSLSSTFQERIRRQQDRVFIAVDEGPGLTCSSLLSVSAALQSLGVPGERIAILSAWKGAPSIYASDEMRARWKSQQVFHTSAEDAFDGWRRLLVLVEDALPAEYPRAPSVTPSSRWRVNDLSYGMWRQACYASSEDWPAVHRPSERTKLLLSRHDDNGNGRPPHRLLAKFAGLGEYGEAKLSRAQILAASGFSPRVEGHAYGFLLYEFLDGEPLSASDLSPDMIERIASYYAFIARAFACKPEPRFEALAQTISYNSGAAGLDAEQFLAYWRAKAEHIDALNLVELDGRPFPHEWLSADTADGRRILKTDSADHALDHTLVGRQSILWDLAGACEEWEMDVAHRTSFVDAWQRAAGSEIATKHLDFYRAAYLAFRTAALHYAIHSTNEEDIRQRLKDQQDRIHFRLAAVLADRGSADACAKPSHMLDQETFLQNP